VQIGSPSEAAALLDLLALINASDDAVATLTVEPPGTREELVAALCPTGDHSTRAAVGRLLDELRIAPGPLAAPVVVGLVSRLALADDLRATITARAPAPHSSLVVTASGSPVLRHLQQDLGLIPLFQLVEDVVRSAAQTCWLGAPYWNAEAIERLWPAIAGFARRSGHVELVCQGGEAADFDPRPILRRAAVDIAGEGGTGRVWAFDARSPEGVPLLLHGKFAVADATLGYLGSANMTRQGFAEHFELGIRLPAVESAHLVSLLERMSATGLLAQYRPTVLEP
jgi:hypothetical protein